MHTPDSSIPRNTPQLHPRLSQQALKLLTIWKGTATFRPSHSNAFPFFVFIAIAGPNVVDCFRPGLCPIATLALPIAMISADILLGLEPIHQRISRFCNLNVYFYTLVAHVCLWHNVHPSVPRGKDTLMAWLTSQFGNSQQFWAKTILFGQREGSMTLLLSETRGLKQASCAANHGTMAESHWCGYLHIPTEKVRCERRFY